MENLSEIVDSLYVKVEDLIKKNQQLNQLNAEMEATLTKERQHHSETTHTLNQLREEAETLRVSNAMLGSEQFKRETKLKINTLIREIDTCISQLSG
ncbi:MAG TPA: hypothetical protein VKZ42_07255 [Flavobacteriaceae bacterium]|nr:hypothetical protein [Flavobacteriaceae bacterium]